MTQRGKQQHRGRQAQDVAHVLEEQLKTARSADGWSIALSAVPIRMQPTCQQSLALNLHLQAVSSE